MFGATSRSTNDSSYRDHHVLARLLWHDVKQNLKAHRVLPLLVLAMYMAYMQARGPRALQFVYLPGAISRFHYWLSQLIPLVAGLMGASVARERRQGITLTILAHGVSRGKYLSSRVLGAAISAALFTLLAVGGFYIVVAIAWLPERETWTYAYSNTYPRYWFPVDNLIVHDMLSTLALMAASAALSLVGVFVGVVVANEYVAMASPLVFAIVSAVLLRDWADAVNPEEYITLYYLRVVPVKFLLMAPFLYWGGFSLLMVALCKRVLAKKELA